MNALFLAIVAVVLLRDAVPLRDDIGIFGLFEHKHRAVATPPKSATSSGGCSVAREQRVTDVTWMLDDLNRLRASAHASSLAFDSRLCTIAVRFADDLVTRHTIGHVSSGGQSPFDRMHAAGIVMHAAGENVARAGNVSAGNHLLYSDPAHRQIMLHARFRHVGLAAVRDRDGSIVFVQDFTD